MSNYVYGYHIVPSSAIDDPRKITEIMNKLSDSGYEIVAFRGSVIYFKKLKK